MKCEFCGNRLGWSDGCNSFSCNGKSRLNSPGIKEIRKWYQLQSINYPWKEVNHDSR